MKQHFSVRTGELSVSTGLFVLGLYVLVQTRSVVEMHSYAQVGSSRLLIDVGIAAALSSGVFYLFTEFLGLSLPVGLLGGF